MNRTEKHEGDESVNKKSD